jgi:hypothetical protein
MPGGRHRELPVRATIMAFRRGWENAGVAASPARRDLPTYRELIYPTLRAVASLGGSARGSEITDALTELLEVTPEQLAVTYDGRPKSVLIDRMNWARSYAKLAGALDSPQRGLFILSNLGKHILSLPAEEGRAQVAQLDRDVRARDVRTTRRRRGASAYSGDLAERDECEPDEGEPSIGATAEDVEAGADGAWREALLARLHRLSPAGFEEFTLYLLRTFGIELTEWAAWATRGSASYAAALTCLRHSRRAVGPGVPWSTPSCTLQQLADWLSSRSRRSLPRVAWASNWTSSGRSGRKSQVRTALSRRNWLS